MPYGAWISNNGTIHFILSDKYSGHYESACDILDELGVTPEPSKTDPDHPDHEDAYNDNVYGTIFAHGYIRLVHDRMYDGKVIYMVENGAAYEKSIRHPLSLAQKSALKNISIKYKKHVFFNGRQVNGYDPDLLGESIKKQLNESKRDLIKLPYSNVDKYPSNRPYGAWIDSKGIIYFTREGQGHNELAWDILEHTHTDIARVDTEDGFYDQLYSSSYIRLVLDSSYNGKKDYIADNGDYRATVRHVLTPSQKAALTNISIKYKTPMWFNGRKIKGYDPELLDESNKNSPIGIPYRNVDKYPSPMYNGGWIANNGTIYKSIGFGCQHSKLADDILTYNHNESNGSDNTYDRMFNFGYIRLVLNSTRDGSTQYLVDNGAHRGIQTFPLSLSQKAALKEISNKYNKQIWFNDRLLYEPLN